MRTSWLVLPLFVLLAGCGSDPAGTSTGSGASGASASASSTGGTAASSTGASSASAGSSTGSGASSSAGSTGTSSSSGSGGSSSSSGGSSGTSGCAVEGVPGTCMDASTCEGTANFTATPGHCPGPSNIQCCTPFGVALCDPAVLRLPNAGHTQEAPGQGGCPAGMLAVATFCIDTYEASLVLDVDGGSWSPYLNPGVAAVRAVSVAGAVPQAYIDQLQATDACAHAGKRLCTDAEWLRACQGPGGDTYPYGDARETGVCNDHRDEHPAVEYFGTADSSIYAHLDNACLDQLPLSLDPAGALPGCVTAEGAFDMMGNLHEWTADPNGTFRGGYYVDTVLNGPGCLYATTAHNASYWDYSTGFRCCAD